MSDPLSTGPRRESPLVAGPAMGPGAPVALSERAFLAQINLRGNPEDPAFLEGCRRVLNLQLPVQPNRFVGDEALSVCWLGPDEWLVLSEGEDAEPSAALEAALEGCQHAVTRIGGGSTCIRVQGPRAADLLARGCSLDLHPQAFAVGHCAQTHLAKALVVLLKRDDEPTFDLIVRRSFADYLWRWLDYVNREILTWA